MEEFSDVERFTDDIAVRKGGLGQVWIRQELVLVKGGIEVDGPADLFGIDNF